MNRAIEQMLSRYPCRNEGEYINALREIMQEIALLGLWRSKFFEHAAFYGGTALRILYGLERGSEDLDFSLLEPDRHFRLDSYGTALKAELESFGFSVAFYSKEKTQPSHIDSAFLKANTRMQMLSIGLGAEITERVHSQQTLKIKLEVDIAPPPGFQCETKTLFRPVPHAVRVLTLPDLLAGKLHAVLCRKWRNRSKGRDWFDMVWYAGHYPAVHLSHLESRMRQSVDYPDDKTLDIERLRAFLDEAIETVNIDQIKQDVLPFVADRRMLDLWSRAFFHEVCRQFVAV